MLRATPPVYRAGGMFHATLPVLRPGGVFQPTSVLLLKKRRSTLRRLQHQLMLKLHQLHWYYGPEMAKPFDCGDDRIMSRYDKIEGEHSAGRTLLGGGVGSPDQYTIEHQTRSRCQQGTGYVMTPVEAMESNFKLAPGELPFYERSPNAHYDIEKKQYKFAVRPFWWKMLPGDDGLSQNHPVYHCGSGSYDALEPTMDNVFFYPSPGERFLPATPEEAAEIEAEFKYEREMGHSMMRCVADLNIVEVPPYYVIGQRTWNTVMPWYKAKKAKGSLSQFESAAQNWTLMVAWNDEDGTAKPMRYPDGENTLTGVETRSSDLKGTTWAPGEGTMKIDLDAQLARVAAEQVQASDTDKIKEDMPKGAHIKGFYQSDGGAEKTTFIPGMVPGQIKGVGDS